MRLFEVIVLLVVSTAVVAAATTADPTSTGRNFTEIVTEVTEVTDVTETSGPTSPGPTPCAVSRWVVVGPNNTICMLMDFNATITDTRGPQNPVEIEIPDKTSTVRSTCEKDKSEFSVVFRYGDNIWELVLRFIKEGGNYKMNMVAIELYSSEGRLIDSSFLGTDFFTAALGEYYSCDDLTEVPLTFPVKITTPMFQPFVQSTTDGCGFGKEHNCYASNGPNVGLIVGCVFGAVAVIAAGGMTFYVIRKKRRNPYDSM